MAHAYYGVNERRMYIKGRQQTKLGERVIFRDTREHRPVEEVGSINHPYPTRWLITPHPALETNQGADKPISIDVELPLREQWILNGRA